MAILSGEPFEVLLSPLGEPPPAGAWGHLRAGGSGALIFSSPAHPLPCCLIPGRDADLPLHDRLTRGRLIGVAEGSPERGMARLRGHLLPLPPRPLGGGLVLSPPGGRRPSLPPLPELLRLFTLHGLGCRVALSPTSGRLCLLTAGEALELELDGGDLRPWRLLPLEQLWPSPEGPLPWCYLPHPLQLGEGGEVQRARVEALLPELGEPGGWLTAWRAYLRHLSVAIEEQDQLPPLLYEGVRARGASRWELTGLGGELSAWQAGVAVELRAPGEGAGPLGECLRLDEAGRALQIEAEAAPPPQGEVWPSVRARRAQLQRRTSSLADVWNRAGEIPHLRELLLREVSADPPPPIPGHEPWQEALTVARRTPDLALILGPPGTGKTHVVRELARTLPGRVLLTSPQHDALDHALDGLERGGLPADRRGGPDGEDRGELHLTRWMSKQQNDMSSAPAPGLQALRDTVRRRSTLTAVTCGQLAAPALGLAALTWDWAIVDEAARAHPLDLLAPMTRARRVILVGDPQQLPHAVEEDLLVSLASDAEALKMSLFARLWRSLPVQERQDGQPRVAMLTQQRRMHPAIADLLSRHFYAGALRSDHLSEGERPPLTPRYGGRPMAWIDVPAGLGTEQRLPGGSLRRQAEVEALRGELLHLTPQLLARPGLRIGVLSFYAAQVMALKEGLLGEGSPLPHAARGQVEVCTVDAAQGREYDGVYLSVVRSQPGADPARQSGAGRRGAGRLGFLEMPSRLCVALSRARSLLVVVGDRQMLVGEGGAGVAALAELAERPPT